MNRAIRFKLFLMMVLEFFIWGAWYPLIFGYLPSLGFTPSEQTWILSCFPVAAIVGMFFSNQFADRNFAAERFLSVSHLIGGVGDAVAGLDQVVLAVLRRDAGALPALRADDLDHEFDRVRADEGRAEGIRHRPHGRHDRLDPRGLADDVHPRGLGQGERGADDRIRRLARHGPRLRPDRTGAAGRDASGRSSSPASRRCSSRPSA